MKVICTTKEVLHSNGGLTYRCLTVDKIYDVIKEEEDTFLSVRCYYVINDMGEEDRFEEANFKLLSDIREEKLNNILE